MNPEFMRRALMLARLADPWPNPRVGAVVVRGDQVIGESYHKRAGGPHAEVEALKRAQPGDELYVTLAPCSAYPGKRTPPCSDLVRRKRVKVYYASRDPHFNEAVGTHLKEFEAEARDLNRPHFKLFETGMPYVVCKWAMTLDGKIATVTGDSKWISSKRARDYAKTFRRDAVLVGVNTVIADDPKLNGVTRIVLDTMARTPLNANILKSGRTILAVSCSAPMDRVRALRKKAEVHLFEVMDLADILKRLARFGVRYVLIEGGGEIHASAFHAGIVDEALVFVAPKIVGGRDARTPVEGPGIEKIADALTFDKVEIRQVGNEAWIHCRK